MIVVQTGQGCNDSGFIARIRGEGVARELIQQARVDTCDDYRDFFLRERGVYEGASVFRRQVSVGRGEEGRSKAKTG